MSVRLDADILAGEMPKEFEELKTEFAQHEGIMRELEQQAQTYRNEHKRDAAERLEQQIVLLKVRNLFLAASAHNSTCVCMYYSRIDVTVTEYLVAIALGMSLTDMERSFSGSRSSQNIKRETALATWTMMVYFRAKTFRPENKQVA